MEQIKRNIKMFSPSAEHRGNDKRVTKNYSLEMNLVHNINEGKPPTTSSKE